MVKLLKFFQYSLVIGILSSCSQIVPATVRNMPSIRVLHKGKIINVALERYVASVLAGEVSSSWPMEALKAQAVASRTFALRRMEERKNNAYHVQNSVSDQVLKATINETLVKAVRESAGLVLTVNQDLAETSFHSTCGGKTADAKNVWGRSYPYLSGGVCGYCHGSPTYHWHVQMPMADIETKLGQKITNIKISSRTKDGRVDKILLMGGKQQYINGHEFRMALGPMKVKSTLIKEIKIQGTSVKISGQGFGHGVGMCQYGALGMAKTGKNYKEILAHYYPKTELRKFY